MSDKPLALVTGGAQGIGLACAQALANDGARIILADINANEVHAAADKMGDGTVAMVCDMGDTDQIDTMYDEIESKHGPLSILVNNCLLYTSPSPRD